MENFSTIVIDWKALTIVAKRPILDVRECPNYIPVLNNFLS